MDWVEVVVDASSESIEAVANLLIEAGAGGVVEVSPTARAAYLPADDQLRARIDRLRRAVSRLAEFGLDPGPATVTCRPVAEEDWAHAWKEHFHPIPIGERLIVRPSWRTYAAGPEEIVIDLDPGMAFGTGTHPTTRLCARALERFVTPESTVADVGTGSGVLAIGAALLGARRVVACDIDPVAVQVARENVAKNGVAQRVEVVHGSWTQLIEAGVIAGVVVANITASVIEVMIPDLPRLIAPEGRFIASGIVSRREADVWAALERRGWQLLGVETEGEWVALEAAPPLERAK